MSYKTLLVHVENTPESGLRLKFAVDLACDFSAKLIGVAGCVPAYLDNTYAGAGYAMYADGSVVQAINDQERTDLKKAKASFDRIAGPLGTAAMWRSSDDYPLKVVEACTAGVDLIVASASRGPRASTIDAGAMALTSGIPVLAIPTDLMGLQRKAIVIAWKNTREARRAVTDALPLLRMAERVTVAQFGNLAEQADASGGLNDVIERLKSHGVMATANAVTKGSGDAAADLIAYAEDSLADLIVSGAYGHSRLREWSFGGMTRGLLQSSTLPVLFSH